MIIKLLQKLKRILICLSLACASIEAKPIQHFIFFGQDRDRLKELASVFDVKSVAGAQVAYSWRQLETGKDQYDFSLIRADLAFLSAKSKKLFVQLQDVSFSEARINAPRYLIEDAAFHGGVAKQYAIKNDDEATATVEGWMTRRWDAAVQARLHKLYLALGKEFDGKIAGINLAETSFEVGTSGRLFPTGFSFEIYRDGIIANLKALKQAFPQSVTMQYANFMPGEWLPDDDKSYLKSVYQAARSLNVGVGGPDLLPFRPGQLNHSYPLLKAAAGIVPVGIAVQEGNYTSKNPKTGKRVTVPELLKFATDTLNVDYIFWCTEEPFFSREVVPMLKRIPF